MLEIKNPSLNQEVQAFFFYFFKNRYSGLQKYFLFVILFTLSYSLVWHEMFSYDNSYLSAMHIVLRVNSNNVCTEVVIKNGIAFLIQFRFVNVIRLAFCLDRNHC